MKQNVKKNIEKKFSYYIDVIKEFAADTYQQFYDKYIKLNNIKDVKYVLPNSILDLDDVLQDFYIKTYELLHKFYTNNCHASIREYLVMNLSIYQREYLDNKVSKYIIEQKNTQIDDDEYYVKTMIKQMKLDKIRKKTLKALTQKEKLQKYQNLIQEILSGKDYNDIYKSCGLNWYEVNVSIEEIGNIYHDNDEEIQISENNKVSEEIETYNNKIDYYKQYLNTKIEEFYKIIYPYFLIDHYQLINYFSNKILEKEYKLRNYLDEPEKFLYGLDKIISELKSLYLNQYFNINIESNIFKNKNFNDKYLDEIIIEKIKVGKIYEIPYYRNYINEFVNEIYSDLQSIYENFDEDKSYYETIFEDFEIIIQEIAHNYFIKNNNLNIFNRHLKKTLEYKKDYYVYNKIMNENNKVKTK